ncbi:MAG TPA: ADOP family duplicated permease, partial [Vicinamibacterales bacterium]|nr:ADOP family duplicated permease [Vicinamibacterales bacterium]
NTRGVTIGIEGDPQRVAAMVARPSLLRMLRARPLVGRIFSEEDGEIGRTRQTVLTYALWQQLYAGSEAAIGGDLRINGEPYTIAGVLPSGFQFIDPDVKLWIPAAFTPEEKSDDSRHSNNWSMVGRLRPDATIAQAREQVDALNARNLERFPEMKEILVNAGFHTVLTPLQEDLVQGVRGTLFLLWGGALFVLLIGAVNLTNLVLVRSSARMKEFATRCALGAAISRMTRQLLTESVMLAAAGGALGLLIGWWGLALLGALGLETLPRASEIRMDGVAVAVSLGLALAVGLPLGLVPVFNLRTMRLNEAFREEGRSATSGRRTRAVRRVLVASQVAFAFMLLIGAGLLLASFQRILGIDPGFEPRNVLTARVSLPASRFAGDSEIRTFVDRLLDRVRSLPGVESAGLTSDIPFGGDYSDSVILAEGYQMTPGESLISPYQIRATPGYFESLGMAIRSGRAFNDGDTDASPRVIVVDEKLARRFWGDADPVGRRMYQPNSVDDLRQPGPDARWSTVVGVVEEIRIAGLVPADDRVGAYYFPIAQSPTRSLTMTVKAAGDPGALVPAIRRELGDIDPELPLYNVMSMSERVGRTLGDRRTPMILAGIFASVALFLAAVGIYGVLAFQVSQRTHEIGIRMALGSNSGGIFALVLKEGLVLLGIGLAAGMLGAAAIGRTLQSQLYETRAMDPVVVAAVAALLGLVAVAACSVPARRAARIDPIQALTR